MNTLVRENNTGTDRRAERAEQFVAPPATVHENQDGYILHVEMPGVAKENIEMWVENNELTIVGRKSQSVIHGSCLHQESRSENFRRVFELDPSINAQKIDAKIDQGVLTLSLPKAEEVKPRKISVA